jgi:hypothetical protein
MAENFNKNPMQVYFNQVKGVVCEIDVQERFSNLTLNVGQEVMRKVNFVAKTPYFQEQTAHIKVGDTVCVKFYLTSNSKNNIWYTTATLLTVEKV